MAGPLRHMQNRNGRYYARMVVPKPLRAIVGKTELSQALSPDKRTAERLLSGVVAEMQRQIDQARAQRQGTVKRPRTSRRAMSPQELAQDHFRGQMEFDSAARNSDPRYAQGFLDMDHVEALERIVNGQADDLAMVETLARPIVSYMKNGNIVAPVRTPEWREAVRALAVAELEAWRQTADRDDGIWDSKPTHPLLTEPLPTPVPPHNPAASARVLGPGSLKTLSQLLPEFLKQKDMTDGSKNEAHVAVRMFEEWLIEARPVHTITRREALQFMDDLIETPSNATKRFPGLTLPQAIRANKERAAPFPAMDLRTVDKWLTVLRTQFKWFVRRDILPDNPFETVRTERKKVAAEPERINFPDSELPNIFSPSNGFGPAREWGEDQWAAVVSLYTGVRPSELAQVTLNNIRREGEVLLMRVEGKLKTRSSWRTVPIHSKLIALGFERRVQQLRSAGETHLFPRWYADGMSALAKAKENAVPTGKPVSRNNFFPKFIPARFNRMLRRIGITDPRLDYYSLRHTFRTKLINAGVIRDLLDRLTGHSDHSASSSYDHSGGNEERTLIGRLHQAIESLKFETINLA